MRFEALTSSSLKEVRSDYRKSARTRFVTDENIEPWALYVMRYKRLDVIDADAAMIGTSTTASFFGKHGN